MRIEDMRLNFRMGNFPVKECIIFLANYTSNADVFESDEYICLTTCEIIIHVIKMAFSMWSQKLDPSIVQVEERTIIVNINMRIEGYETKF